MSRRPLPAEITGATIAAVATLLGRAWLERHPPAGASRWERPNHRGLPVSLLEGPAVALGVLTGLLGPPTVRSRVRVAGLTAVSAAAIVGAYDDASGGGQPKGLHGHLRALSQGRLTSGMVKVVVLAASGVVTGALLRPAGLRPVSALGRLATDAALVAGAANLLNLFDLRPGRALKVALLAAATLGSAGATPSGVGAVAGAAAAALPADLTERSMLGDCGANALGAALGCAVAAADSRPLRVAALGLIASLTLVSEKTSFSAVIDASPALSWLDRLGRSGRRPQGRLQRHSSGLAAGAASTTFLARC